MTKLSLSKNFRLIEFENSEIAKINNIDNTAPAEVVVNLQYLTTYLLQPLRNKLNREVYINSGYRCEKLNTLVKGVLNSQHLKGEAADIVVEGMTSQEVASFIKNNFEFDQLIIYDTFCHVSLKKNNNRNQMFNAA